MGPKEIRRKNQRIRVGGNIKLHIGTMPKISECTSLKARIIALYLPQYHPIPENDAWWGKGFTEWTNVKKARPMFRGHYQPRIPADLGFYDLRVPETRAAQAEMARAHGIEGFCYWHYWFAGDRLLERPFQEVLESGEPDFPFCLAWANESWTGIWHGSPHRILKLQTYPGREDYESHFHSILKALCDDRYIKVGGKQLILIYRPQQLPDAHEFSDCWRELAVKTGLKGLYLVANINSESWDPHLHGFDAVTIPNIINTSQVQHSNFLKRHYRTLLSRPRVKALYQRILKRPIHVYPYEEALQYFIIERNLGYPYHPSLIPNWDNTPRSGVEGFVLHNSTPELFRRQVQKAIQVSHRESPEHRLIFVKSWNEWAEGNYLEPDQRWGRKYLEVIRDENRDADPVKSS